MAVHYYKKYVTVFDSTKSLSTAVVIDDEAQARIFCGYFYLGFISLTFFEYMLFAITSVY
jgi:hypothetical protein